MWRTQKAIIPLFFVLLSFSTWSTIARENRNIDKTTSESVYDFTIGKESLRNKREDGKQVHTIETIDSSEPRITAEVTQDGYESVVHNRREVEHGRQQEKGEYNIDLSSDIARPIGKDSENLTLEEERMAVLRHLEDLISKVSALAEKANMTNEISNDSIPISTSAIIEDKEQNVYEDSEPVHDERNRLPKRHLISADESSLVGSAASAASAAAASASSAVSSATASSSSFVLPTPLPLQVLEELSCAVESVEHGHSHVLGIIVHEVLCEARKLWHYLLHALHNLKSEISLGPQINIAEAYAGASSFSGFLERSPVILEEVLKKPHHLLALPEIVKSAVPLESIFSTFHRLKHGLHKLVGILHTVIREKLHDGLHNRLDQLRELGLLEKLLPLEGLSTVSSAVASASASSSSSSSGTVLPLTGNSAQEILHAAKAVYDAYHASGFNEILGSGSSASSSASSVASSGPSSAASSASSSASSTSYGTTGSYPAPVLPVIPLTSETETTSTSTTTTTNEEVVSVERPVVSVPLESPATVSTTTSTATATVVASEPEVVVNRPVVVGRPEVVVNRPVVVGTPEVAINRPVVVETPLSSTVASSSSTSSSNLLSQPQFLNPVRPAIPSITPLVSPISSGSASSASSASSTVLSRPASLVAPVETVDTVASAVSSSSASSTSLPAAVPTVLSQIRPILSEISSKVKAQSSASAAAVASVIGHNKDHHHSHKHHGHHKGVKEYETSSVVASAASSAAASSSGANLLSRPNELLSPISLSNGVSSSSSSSAVSSSNNIATSPLTNFNSATASSSSSASSKSPLVLAGQQFIRPVLSTVVPFVESSQVSSTASSSASSSSDSTPVSPITYLRNFGKSFVPNIVPRTSIDSSSASSSSTASTSSNPVVLAGQKILRPVISTVVPFVESIQTSSAASSSASSSSNNSPAYPLTNINSASASSSASANSSPNPGILARQQILRPVLPTVVPYVESTKTSSAAASSAASSSSSPSSSSAVSSAASSATSSSNSYGSPWRLKLPVILPREKVIAAIGSNGVVPGDVVVITLKSKKSLFARILDNDGPISFSLLRPRIASSVFQNAGTVWNLSPRDFQDVTCTNLFDGIY